MPDRRSPRQLVTILFSAALLGACASGGAERASEWSAGSFVALSRTADTDLVGDVVLQDARIESGPLDAGLRFAFWPARPAWLGLALDVATLAADIPPQTVQRCDGTVCDQATITAGARQSHLGVSLEPTLRFGLWSGERFPGGRIQPYLGAGPRLGFARWQELAFESGTFSLGWNGAAGATAWISDGVGLFAEYRYSRVTVDYDVNVAGSPGTLATALETQRVALGLSFRPARRPAEPAEPPVVVASATVADARNAAPPPPRPLSAWVAGRCVLSVRFPFDSDRLEDRAAAVVRNAIASFHTAPESRIVVIGHTDDAGRSSYNLDLSRRRAERVARYLVLNGVPREQVTVRGRGEAEPIGDNRTAAGRSLNRRTILWVPPGEGASGAGLQDCFQGVVSGPFPGGARR